MAQCIDPEVCHHPRCGYPNCRGKYAIAKIRYPLSKPYHERQTMHVCEEHLDVMGMMFGGEN